MKDESRTVGNTSLTDRFGDSARRTVTVDIEKYQKYLDDSGLSAEQKEEFLLALWSVVVSFVELGFGVHPLQEVCGKDAASGSGLLGDAFDRVDSNTSGKSKPVTDSRPPGGLEVE